MNIKNMQVVDWRAVQEIYKDGIATQNATFETEVPGWEEWDKNHLKSCRLVISREDEILAWAALSPVSGRCIYSGVAEVSIYVAKEWRGKGFGKKLLGRLIADSEDENIWTLQAGIFPENESSIRLHEKMGFRKIGYREKIGQLFGVWRDIILLERRSKIVGI
jgi:phosphinothricin acetyltransferase